MSPPLGIRPRIVGLCVLAVVCLAPPGWSQQPKAAPEPPDRSIMVRERGDRVAYSPDGKFIAVAEQARYHYATLYGRESGQPFLRISGVAGDLFTFTSDSKHFLTHRGKRPKAGPDRWEVSIWAIPDGHLVRRFELLPRHEVVSGFYAASDKTLIVFTRDAIITSYDLTTGKLIGDFPNKEHAPRLLTLSPDGKWLLTARDRELRLWDVQGRKLLHELYDFGRYEKVAAVAISPDGTWCAAAVKRSGGGENGLFVFDRAKGTEAGRTALSIVDLHTLHFAPNEKSLLVTGYGAHHGLNVWDWDKGEGIRGGLPKGGILSVLDTAEAKKWNLGRLYAFGVGSDGTMLTTGTKAGELRLWFDKPQKKPVDVEDPEPPRPKTKAKQ